MNDRAPLRKGPIAVVAAQTGLGKTIFTLNTAKHASENGHAALIVSLVMRREELCDRLIANESRILLDDIQNFGTDLPTGDRSAILDAAALVKTLPLHVVDAFETTPAGVAAQRRKQCENGRSTYSLLITCNYSTRTTPAATVLSMLHYAVERRRTSQTNWTLR